MRKMAATVETIPYDMLAGHNYNPEPTIDGMAPARRFDPDRERGAMLNADG